MVQPFPVAGSWWLQPTLTATANRTLCFTDPPRVKQRYGISITTFTSAPLTARLSRPAGAWPKGAWSKTLADAETGIIEGLRDAHPDYLLFNSAARQTVIWYLNNNVRIGGASGPTPPSGWSVVAP